VDSPQSRKAQKTNRCKARPARADGEALIIPLTLKFDAEIRATVRFRAVVLGRRMQNQLPNRHRRPPRCTGRYPKTESRSALAGQLVTAETPWRRVLAKSNWRSSAPGKPSIANQQPGQIHQLRSLRVASTLSSHQIRRSGRWHGGECDLGGAGWNSSSGSPCPCPAIAT